MSVFNRYSILILHSTLNKRRPCWEALKIWVYQDRQCRYNTTMRRVRATIVGVEKQRVLHNLSLCICNLRYPACKAHAPCCHPWPAPLYNIFPHFLINGTIFEKEKVTEHKMCDYILITNLMHCHSSWWPVGTQLVVYRQATTNCDSTICCMYTTASLWRWALEAWNM